MNRIVCDPAVRGGQPVVRGSRVTVCDILAQIARGASLRDVLRVFPLLSAEDVQSALEYAARATEAAEGGPKLSLVVVVYSMPEQAKRTLFSVSAEYQLGVSERDYEVIVVENASSRPLGKEEAVAGRSNVRYFYQRDPSSSPVGAANFGVEQARAPVVGLMIDGARMLTPGVVRTVLDALRITEQAVVAVPGYHLGNEPQQRAVVSGYDERSEAELLKRIAWPAEGYRLFEVACLSRSYGSGFLRPFAESNCLCMSKRLFDDLGGYDPRFDLPGGGYCNPDLFFRVCDRADVRLFVTPGEGSFHQYHGGVTTGGERAEARADLMRRALDQYELLRGKFMLRSREVTLIGTVSPSARRFLALSASEQQPTDKPRRALAG